MDKISVSEIGNLFGVNIKDDKYISSVVINTAEIEKDCLFVCIKGERFDGNDFAQKAIDSGAAAVICNDYAAVSGTAIRVEDTRSALLKLAQWYRSRFDIPVVALTGSVGKTTTKEMIHLVLSGKYNTLKTQGNLNNEIGLPRTLLNMDGDTQAAVIEMGMNHKGEISALSKATMANMGVITNIGVSHIENLGSRDGIFNAKMEMLGGLMNGAPLVLNGDDDFLSTVKSTDNHPVYAYGVHSGDFKAINISQNGGTADFIVEFFGKKQEIHLPAAGIHNVYNALAGFAVGYLLGVSPQTAASQLEKYAPEGMRQKITSVDGITCIEDCYNASPDSMKALIGTLSGMKANKRAAVLADMLELGGYAEKAHSDVGKMVSDAKIDYLFAYGNDASFYVKGAESGGFTQCFLFDDKEKLASALNETVSSGDAVAFKGSRGMKLEDVIKSFYNKRGKKHE